MFIEHESDEYAYLYDSKYGYGMFMRKVDGSVSALETGSNCVETRKQLHRLSQKVKENEKFNSLFNSLASEYSYNG